MRSKKSLTAVALCMAVVVPIASDMAGAATLDPASEGRRLFLKLNCYSCHGMHGAGGMGPNIQHSQFADVNEAMLYGEGGGMPPYKKYVTAKDIRNLQVYLATTGTNKEPVWLDWWNPIP